MLLCALAPMIYSSIGKKTRLADHNLRVIRSESAGEVAFVSCSSTIGGGEARAD